MAWQVLGRQNPALECVLAVDDDPLTLGHPRYRLAIGAEYVAEALRDDLDGLLRTHFLPYLSLRRANVADPEGGSLRFECRPASRASAPSTKALYAPCSQAAIESTLCWCLRRLLSPKL